MPFEMSAAVPPPKVTNPSRRSAVGKFDHKSGTIAQIDVHTVREGSDIVVEAVGGVEAVRSRAEQFQVRIGSRGSVGGLEDVDGTFDVRTGVRDAESDAVDGEHVVPHVSSV